MLFSHVLGDSFSKYWLTSDFRMGLCHVRYPVNDFHSLPHTHAEYSLVICLHGRIEFGLRRQTFTLEPGDLLVVNPGEMHQSQYGAAASSCEGVSIILTRPALLDLFEEADALNHLKLHDIMFLGKRRDLRALRLSEELVNELHARETGYEILVRSLVFQIVIHLLRHSLEPVFDTIYSPLPRQLPCWEMNRVMEYMNTHGKNSFSLAELCSTIGSCPSRFIVLFRNSTQLNPHIYYNRLLVKKAQILLRSGRPPIKEVAYSLGFQDVSHFCELFKKVSGMTPRAYQVRPD